MASKNIAVRMDVIRRLDQAKRPGESYSDVIERFVDARPSLLEALAYAREHPIQGRDTLGPRVRKIREETNRSFERRAKKLEEMS